ncbi:hypothetical protein [Flexivirga aerilata]|nr:hypothetical protein [Flexivirga aerilata]
MLQTFSLPGWRPEPLLAPGARRNTGTMHATTTCDCGACAASYATLTGAD